MSSAGFWQEAGHSSSSSTSSNSAAGGGGEDAAPTGSLGWAPSPLRRRHRRRRKGRKFRNGETSGTGLEEEERK
jgi:hypothetical protein